MNTLQLSESEMSQIQIALSSRIEFLSCVLGCVYDDMSMSTEFEDRLIRQKHICENVLARIRGEA